MSANTDKNLLFGLIAFQNGYITMEQFMEAGAIWNKDPNRQLAEILLELKYIEDVERHNIQGIVDDRVRRLGGLENSISFSIQNGSVPDGQGMPEDWKSKIEDVTKIIQNNATPSPPRFKNTEEQDKGIHRYIIRKTLGHGGQGYVWEAVDTELKRKVAVKNIVPKLSSDPLHQELLIDEARKTGKLAHPGVPPVFDIGMDAEGKPFFTMQLISGVKLSERYQQIKYEQITKSEFVNQIRPMLRHLIAACNTVQFAFDEETVIHRDLKPANIMVNDHGATVVMDWGMGKVVDDPSSEPSNVTHKESSVFFIPVPNDSGSGQKTSAGTIKGTAEFMSPEQARAENDRLDHRTDVYGLGAILYWILTGRPPHKIRKETLATFNDDLQRIQRNLFPTPSQARPSLRIPRELEAICLKAMASDPQNRYQKAGDLAADLDNFIAGEPVSALPDNALRKAERFLRKHARAVIASLLGLSIAVLGLTWANMVISSKNRLITEQKTSLESNQQKLLAEQQRTKDSRGVSSEILDKLVGYLVDNKLAEIPGGESVRIPILERMVDSTEKYLAKNPDDVELKLDLIRILTRLAKLQQDQQQEELAPKARRNWQRADELLRETKESTDQTLQINWKRAFCDKAYYNLNLLFREGKNEEAATLLGEALTHAEAVVSAAEDKRNDFAPTYAGLSRRQSDLFERSGKFPEALAETQKGRKVLEPLVEKYLYPSSIDESDKELIPESELNHGTIGVYFLLCGDQSDYETVLGNLEQAEQSALTAMKACNLAPRVHRAKRDGVIQSGTNFRRLQRNALMREDFQKAEKYYEECKAFITTNQEEPLLKKALFFIESDRARGLAKSDLVKATSAHEQSVGVFESILMDENPESVSLRSTRSIAEMEYCIAASKLALAVANGQSQELQALSQEKDRCIAKLNELKASPYKMKEMSLLP